MLLPVRFRQQMLTLGHKLLENLEGMSASFSTLFTKEHNPDGTHSAITADSITVADLPTVALAVYSLTGATVVSNTNTAPIATGTLTFSIEDGDIIRIIGSASIENNTGATRGFELFLDIGGTQVSLGGDSTAWADGTDREAGIDLTIIRQGLTLYVSGWFDLTSVEGIFTPGLAKGRPIKVQINLTASSSNLSVGVNRALALHYRTVG